MTLNPVLGRQKEADLKTSLVYGLSLRRARDKQRNPVLKNKTKNNNNIKLRNI